MISSSEVGGCCRVQVARLFPSLALSSFSSPSSSSSLLPLLSLPAAAIPRFPSCSGMFSPSRSLSLSLASTLLVLSRPFYLQKFKPRHHCRSYARTTRSLQGCSPFHPRLLPGTCRLFMGPRSMNTVSESFYFGRNLIDDRDFFEYSLGENIYPAPACFLYDTFSLNLFR